MLLLGLPFSALSTGLKSAHLSANADGLIVLYVGAPVVVIFFSTASLK